MEDDDMKAPRDAYLSQYTAAKFEAKKIWQHKSFEDVATKFWTLLRSDKSADLSINAITREQYIMFMKRVYKVLLPLYREKEMATEIEHEWRMDCSNAPALSLHLFTKVLFRICHQWAVHIDLDEYCELLNVIYSRITAREAVLAKDGSIMRCNPTVFVTVIPDASEAEQFAPSSSSADAALYEPCQPGEIERAEYEYQWIEDPATMTVAKHRKRKLGGPPKPVDDLSFDQSPVLSIKEAIMQKEKVVYYQNSGDYKPCADDTVYYVLADLEDVLPLGYPTEQFLVWTRNDVNDRIEETRRQRKEYQARMKRANIEDGDGGMKEAALMKRDEDDGLIPGASGNMITRSFPMTLGSNCKTRAKCELVDKLFNAIRNAIKETNSCILRYNWEFPKQSVRNGTSKAKPSLSSSEPCTEINSTGYNPALQRRVFFKQVPIFSKKGKCCFVNIQYTYAHPDFEAAYRCDHEKFEKAGKLLTQPNEQTLSKEEFVPCETSYKQVRHIMLWKKFETMYTESLLGKDGGDDGEDGMAADRVEKIVEREEQRRAKIRTVDAFNSKGLSQTYEEKNMLIKMMKGPYYKLMSGGGLVDDDFMTCATQDLIDYATRPAPRVLLLGKPRAGKTTLARKLASRLDLVHASIENWLDKLQAKIRDKPEDEEIPPEDERPEDFVMPPPYFTELESTVKERLYVGKGPTHKQNIEILRCEMNSPEARTKGFILDLHFYKIPDYQTVAAEEAAEQAEIDAKKAREAELAAAAAAAEEAARLAEEAEGAENEGGEAEGFSPREWADNWGKVIHMHQLLGPDAEVGSAQQFSHVIELEYEDEEIKLRTKHIRLDNDASMPPVSADDEEKKKPYSETEKLYSRWDRAERAKPPPPKFDEDGNPVELEEDELPKPLVETDLLARVQDDDEYLNNELRHYSSVERPNMDEFIMKLNNDQFMRIDAAGKTPDEIASAAEWLIQPDSSVPLKPSPKQVEGSGDFAALLTDPIPGPNGEDPPEGTLPRTYSLWQQTDPVALHRGKVVPGVPENAVCYANNMFAFAEEENMKAFMEEPRKYISSPPKMPDCYRLLMLGPKGIGVHTQAAKLSEKYGWRVIDYPQLVKDKLMGILSEDVHMPNNVDPEESVIGLKQEEIDEIKAGKPFASWKFLPWVLHELGYALQKRPAAEVPPEEEPDLDAMSPEEKTAYEKAQKKKAQEEAAKAKELAAKEAEKEDLRRRRAEAEAAGAGPEALAELASIKEPPEDLSIEDLVLAPIDESGKLPDVGGFILIGFPQTELHAQKLKEHHIEFDKILYLTDANEEEPGKECKARMEVNDLHYDWDAELEKAGKVKAIAEEHINGEIISEIQATGSIEDVHHKIAMEIDPFLLRVDTLERGDLEKPLPRGDFGDYCPVTYMKDNWLAKGVPENPELETTVYGKTFRFAGEKEIEEFKFNPAKFLPGHGGKQELPLLPPPPKIMIVGQKGAGVTTQIDLLCKKYKLDSLKLKEDFLKHMDTEKQKRRRTRQLEKGFRAPVFEEGENGEQVQQPDPEIDEDGDDFDKEQHEKELVRLVFSDTSKGLIIDGTWNGFPEEAVTATDGAGFVNLLAEARRPPEIVVVLKCNEKSAVKRMIDEKAIQAEFDRLMKIREDRIKKEFEEAKEAKAKELQEELAGNEEMPQEEKDKTFADQMKAWEEEKKEEDPGDDDLPNLEEMKTKELETLQEQRGADLEFLDAMVEALAEKNLPCIKELKTDTSAEFVHLKLVDLLKDHFKLRPSLIERQLAQPLTEKELPFYEQSFTYKQSKFGINCPMHQTNPAKTKATPVLYRERIYYLGGPEARDMFCADPARFTKGVEAVPLDVPLKPQCLVLGPPKSGKSTLCEQIARETGAVHLKIDDIVGAYIDKASAHYVDRDAAALDKLKKTMLAGGHAVEDLQLIQLVCKRLQDRDCLERGWLLEDFPKTRAQAVQLARSNVQPATVINIRLPLDETVKRTDKDIEAYWRQKAEEEAKAAAAKGEEDEAPEEDEDGAKPKKSVPVVVPPDDLFAANRAIVAQRLRFSCQHIGQVTNFYQRIYNSVIEIDGMKSKWFVLDRASMFIEDNLKARQHFVRSQCHARDPKLTEQPTEMVNLNYDKCLLKAALSQFGYFCPVTWKNTKQLVKCAQNQDLVVLYELSFYYFRGQAEKDMFLANPKRFTNNIIFSSAKGIPIRLYLHKAAEIVNQEKAIIGHCPVALTDFKKVVKGDPLLVVQYKEKKFVFADELKLQSFLTNPARYHKADLPVKMPPHEDPVSLFDLHQNEDSTIFMEQALGSVVTKGLREVSENRLKHPGMSVKETTLKLFALFLKAENCANTDYMKQKYMDRMREFIETCELAEELAALAEEKKQKGDRWPAFKEKYYNELGQKYDAACAQAAKEAADGFKGYLK